MTNTAGSCHDADRILPVISLDSRRRRHVAYDHGMEPSEVIQLAMLPVIVALKVASPLVRVPIGPIVALYALKLPDLGLGGAIALGVAGAVLGRWLLVLAGRSGRAGLSGPAAARQDAMREALGRSDDYRRMTFMAGAVALVPARYVFPLLGAMRMPTGFALAGALVGQFVLIGASAGLSRWLALAATGQEARDAARLLAAVVIVLVVLGMLRMIDLEATRRDRRLRWHDPDASWMGSFSLFGTGTGDAGPDGSGYQPSAADDEIEGEVVDEEVDPGDTPPRELPADSDGA